MIRGAIDNPYAAIVGMAIAVMFGVMAMMTIPIQLKPVIEPAEITITTSYWGASPLEVEDQITNKIEKEVSSISDLRLVTSSSQEGQSTVSLTFIDDVDRDKALIDTIQALKRVTDLPALALEPLVTLGSGQETEMIMWVTVAGEASVNEKWDMISEVVQPSLLRSPGVGGIQFFGGADRKIIVEPDPEKCVHQGVTFGEIAQTVGSQNINARGGYVEEGDRQFLVRTLGKYESLDDVRQTVLRHSPMGTLTVGDVATVIDGRDRMMGYVEVDGKSAVVMGINRQSGANTVTTIKHLQEAIDVFNNRFIDAKLAMQLEVTYSELAYVNEAISLVRNNLLLGALLAAIILALFLREGRPITIVLTSIPVSLLTVFIVLQIMGRTINIISLAGLAFSVGMVIDCAIVVLENIDRHLRQLKKPPRQAALDGVKEIGGAVFAATLTTLAVFIPIVMNTTEAGLLFKDIAIAIVSAVAMSLVSAMVLVPSLSAMLMRQTCTRQRIAETNPGLDATLNIFELRWLGHWVVRFYTSFIERITHRRTSSSFLRWSFLGIVTVLFLFSLVLLPSANYLPNGTREFIFVVAQPVVGQRNDVTMEALGPVQDFGDQDPRIGHHFTVSANPFFTGIGLIVDKEFADDENLNEIVASVMQLGFMGMPGFQYVFPMRMSIFNVADKQFTIEVTGDELAELKKTSDSITAQLYGMGDLVEFVRTDYTEGVPELAVELDGYRVSELGESLSNVAMSVEMLLGGREVSQYSEAGREYDLWVRANPDLIKDRDSLRQFPFVTRSGNVVQLGDIAKVTENTGPSSVRHYNRTRSIQITVTTNPQIPTAEALSQVNTAIVKPMMEGMPPGYSVRFGDASDKLRTTLSSLMFQGMLAVIIVYLLLVALFRSFTYPLVILVTIPLAWSGSFIALSIANKVTNGVVQLDVLGMLGLIILTGIVVNNAILIVHQMLNNEKEGMDPQEALRSSARTRLRPIFMSVLTSVCGMLPLALGRGSGSELYRGLGIIVVGGLLVSTVFTLFVVPTILSMLQNAKLSAQERKASREAG